MGYIPHIVSIKSVDPKYLQYSDKWSSVISPIVYVAENPVTPTQILEALSTHKLVEVRIAVAKNSNTPPDVLENLFNNKNIDVRAAVLWNPKVKTRYFEAVLNKIDIAFYERLADCWNSPPAVLEELYLRIKDYPEQQTRIKLIGKLASNPNTPETILKEIFKQKAFFLIYQDLSKNPKIINEIISEGKKGNLEALKGKYGLADNDDFLERTITYVLHEEAFKPPFENKYEIPINLLIILHEKSAYEPTISKALARNENTPPDVIGRLVKKINEPSAKKAAYIVLANPKLSRQDLSAFCKLTDKTILSLLAANPGITAECLDKITREIEKNNRIETDNNFESYMILSSLAKNPSTPERTLKMIIEYAEQKHNKELLNSAVLTAIPNLKINFDYLSNYIAEDDAEAFKEFNTDAPESIMNLRGNTVFLLYKYALTKRVKKLQAPNEVVTFLRTASRSSSALIRAFVASNQSTPVDILKQFAADSSLLVKLELARNKNITESIVEKLLSSKEMIVFDERNCSYE